MQILPPLSKKIINLVTRMYLCLRYLGNTRPGLSSEALFQGIVEKNFFGGAVLNMINEDIGRVWRL